ncbi:fmt [Symbiodinium sp. CCMP2592]|nr:fmt [Symbiodinium sp. CCMP2592]
MALSGSQLEGRCRSKIVGQKRSSAKVQAAIAVLAVCFCEVVPTGWCAHRGQGIGLGTSQLFPRHLRNRWQRGRSQRCTRFAEGSPGRVVFLGSPDCVEVVLQSLWNASQASTDFEVCAVVSRPPKRVKKAIAKTPVHALAEDLGISNILTPPSARDEAFLEKLEELKPDVCVTAAYGEYLPRRFLEAPRLGTINLHPSLLPRWRGASPVQRCLVAGDTETGITILYTVAKMDAGPIIVQEKMALDGSETSPELLEKLFRWGGDLLVEVLPKILAGEVSMDTAAVQDEGLVEKAPLISKDEGKLWPHNETALQMRDKVRGFTGWPGTTLAIACSGSKAPPQGVRVKVAGAEVVPLSAFASSASPDAPLQELLFMPAVDGSEPAVGLRPAVDPENVLLLKSFQLPGKKEVPAKTFRKGYMTFQPAKWLSPEEESEMVSATGAFKKQKKVRR